MTRHDQAGRMDALCLTDLAAIASGHGDDLLLRTYEERIRHYSQVGL
ncbi:hypothetical protein [Spirosoma fluviale]|nr:hypothetical protein [Spirosoma fluviale]